MSEYNFHTQIRVEGDKISDLSDDAVHILLSRMVTGMTEDIIREINKKTGRRLKAREVLVRV